MASAAQFNAYPPFPQDVPAAVLNKISLAKLSAGDAEEAKALFNCCRTVGFFLLDLSGDETGEALVNDIDAALDIAKQVMELPEEEKRKHHMNPPEKLVGYKSLGYMKTETNQPDRCEFFMVPQDDLNLTSPPDFPLPIASNLPIFQSYLSHAQPILNVICRSLSTSFHLPPSTFSSKQSPTSLSGTKIRLIKYPAISSPADRRTSLLPHTDMGTITLLANVLGGLQILPSSAEDRPENWLHVKPEPNCLIVNIGDAMVQWSGGVLRSNVHRVTFPPGIQADFDRYSVAYLVRANADADMRVLKGGLIPDVEGEEIEMTAGEWEKKKSVALREGKDCVKSTGGRPLRGEAIKV